jgi:hypothetical protein
MKIKKIPVLVLALIPAIMFIQACNYIGVTSDYDPGVNFAAFDTFSTPKIRASGTGRINELDRERLIEAIRSEMRARGYREVSRGAELKVEAHLVAEEKRTVEAETEYSGGRSTTSYNVYEYTEGTLIIDIREAQTNRLLWQGIGEGAMDKTAKNRQERANRAAAKIFAQYPVQKYQ